MIRTIYWALLENYLTWEQSWGPKIQCNPKLNYHITKTNTTDLGIHITDFEQAYNSISESKNAWIFKSGQLAHLRHKSAYFQRDKMMLVNLLRNKILTKARSKFKDLYIPTKHNTMP